MSKYYDIEQVRKHKKLHFILRKKEIIYSVWCNVELDHAISSKKLHTGTLTDCKRFCKEHNIDLKRTD